MYFDCLLLAILFTIHSIIPPWKQYAVFTKIAASLFLHLQSVCEQGLDVVLNN